MLADRVDDRRDRGGGGGDIELGTRQCRGTRAPDSAQIDPGEHRAKSRRASHSMTRWSDHDWDPGSVALAGRRRGRRTVIAG